MDWKLFKTLNSLMMPACSIVGGTMYITDAKEAVWVMEVNATANSVQRLSKLSSAGTLHRPADLQPIECRRRAADLICCEKFICRVEALLLSGVIKPGPLSRTLSAQRFHGISTIY